MSDGRAAIHICTGKHAAVRRIDQWLGSHGVAVLRFEDVFAACAYVLGHRPEAPELAFVGSDGLERDEIEIVRFLRDTWPAIGIVIYGSAFTGDPPRQDALSLVLASDAAVRQMTGLPPDRVLQRLRRHASDTRSCDDALEDLRPAGTANSGDDANRSPPANPSGERPAARQPSSRSPVGETPLPPAGGPLRSILTRAELDALLEDPRA